MISCGGFLGDLRLKFGGEVLFLSYISQGQRPSDLNSDGQPYYVHVKTPFILKLPAVVKGCLQKQNV